MIEWLEQSRNRERFWEAKASAEPVALDVALAAIRDTLNDRILGEGNATRFDLLMIEVNCDTGRLIGAASTEQVWKEGRADGCSVRVQELQDYWYDLLDAGISDLEFERRIRERVLEVGGAFMLLIEQSLAMLRPKAGRGGFRLVVFGGTPGEIVLDRHFQ